jgi:putative restriction endonuclease
MDDFSGKYDEPIFKRLAHNDTGRAVGHQGGIVIPKALDAYFPQLSRNVSAARPTVEVYVEATLFDGPRFLGTVETRYQYQTWGGTRSPERRLTGSLGKIRDLAKAGDILLIERAMFDLGDFRLTLLRRGTPEFSVIDALAAGRPWGPVSLDQRPSSEVEADIEQEQQAQREALPFQLFDPNAGFVESRTLRIARSRAFKLRVSDVYARRCAFCGMAYTRRDGRNETEAAHIVPRSLKGSDDVRNGLLLCRSHHWAFDYGLVGVQPDNRITVGAGALTNPHNSTLGALVGQPLLIPGDPLLHPDQTALAWHRENRFEP